MYTSGLFMVSSARTGGVPDLRCHHVCKMYAMRTHDRRRWESGADFERAAKYSRNRKILQTLDRDGGTPMANATSRVRPAGVCVDAVPEAPGRWHIYCKSICRSFWKALQKVRHESFICGSPV
jgi:hypothetical protein